MDLNDLNLDQLYGLLSARLSKQARLETQQDQIGNVYSPMVEIQTEEISKATESDVDAQKF